MMVMIMMVMMDDVMMMMMMMVMMMMMMMDEIMGDICAYIMFTYTVYSYATHRDRNCLASQGC